MTSKKTLEEFLTGVSNRINELERRLNDAIDLVGCLQTENDDLKAQLKRYEDERK